MQKHKLYSILSTGLILSLTGCALHNPQVLKQDNTSMTMKYSKDKKLVAMTKAANYCRSQEMYTVTLSSEEKQDGKLIGIWTCK